MSEFLAGAFGVPAAWPQMLVRLMAALVLGGGVLLVYRRTRLAHEIAPSFTVTLVMLTVLIALVTQVIGESVARAFSLVGALSIIRFRTIVRDTQDTAYVICAVALGMAIGQANLVAAVLGLAVVALAAFLLRRRHDPPHQSDLPFSIDVRVALGHDATTLLRPVLDQFSAERQLVLVSTARQGASIDVSYRVSLRQPATPDEFVKALNRLDGVQSVTLQRNDADDT